MTRCPECGGFLDIEEDEVEQGDTLSCPECGVDLEVAGTNPVDLRLLEDFEEDEDEWGEDESDETEDDLGKGDNGFR